MMNQRNRPELSESPVETKALAAAEALNLRLREAIEKVSDGVAFWDTEGRYILANQRFRDLAGSDVILDDGTDFPDFIAALLKVADPASATVDRAQWIDNQASVHEDLPHELEIYRDGRRLRWRHDLAPDGSIASFVADVTGVREREQELQQIMNAVPMMLGYVDHSGCYQMINRTFEEWFAVSGEAIRGRPAGDIHDARVFRVLRRHMNAALRGNEIRFEASIPYAGETGVPGYQGERRIEVIYTPDKNAEGQTAGFFIAANDVTQRMLADARLHQSQKMEAIGQLTGGIAHDFNNLLAVIVGSLGLLESGVSGERESRLLQSARRAAGRGGELTQRLLAFGRRQALMTEITNPNELIGGLTELLRRTLGPTIEIETRPAADVPLMDVDRGQLENALLNLSINARDAMPEGGRLVIETRTIKRGQREEGSAGSYVMIMVTDSGIGMDVDTKNRAIEPFFTTKQIGEGSGLGLSTVYGFAKQSGGDLHIESAPGLGTTVKLYLPATEADASEPAASHIVTENLRSQGERILVIEDDQNVRMTTVAMLEDLGYEVIEAETGQGALDLVDTGETFDLVFSDVFLPGGINGPEAVTRIKLMKPGVAVLFTSGYSADRLTRNDLVEDTRQMISKPFEMEALARKLRECLDNG